MTLILVTVSLLLGTLLVVAVDKLVGAFHKLDKKERHLETLDKKLRRKEKRIESLEETLSHAQNEDGDTYERSDVHFDEVRFDLTRPPDLPWQS